MKIAYLYHSIAVHGGIERVLVDKMNYLADKTNNCIYIITSDQKEKALSYNLSKKVQLIDLEGIKYFSIYHHKYPMRLFYLYRFNQDYRKRLTKVMNEIKPDIIISNTTLNTTLIANLKTNAKKIIESHSAKEFIIKAGKEHRDINPIEFIFKSIFDWYMCHLINKFDKLVLLTKRDYSQWKEINNKVIIPNPLTLFPENISQNNNKIIICAARLYREKGLDLLIKAWSKVSPKYADWKINIYGDGYMHDELIGMAKKYNVSKNLIINKSVSNIYDKYSDAEFLVLSSRTEGFGLVLAEAMSCGRPCVSFNCPSGPDEIITDGVDGLLAENGNTDDLADKIEWMITHEKERKEMGIKARESSKRFKQDVIMEQWIKLFNDLTEIE